MPLFTEVGTSQLVPAYRVKCAVCTACGEHAIAERARLVLTMQAAPLLQVTPVKHGTSSTQISTEIRSSDASLAGALFGRRSPRCGGSSREGAASSAAAAAAVGACGGGRCSWRRRSSGRGRLDRRRA
eukprot:4353293-Pleurochrysis_carterae.AAC.1